MSATSKTVGVLLYPHCTLLDFAGATQMFAEWAGHWNPIWIAESPGPVPTSEGVEVVAGYGLNDHPPLDIVFVPGGAGAAVAAEMENPAIQDWLKAQDDGARWIGGICVGTFILAAAGLLRDASVSTHWLLVPTLRDAASKFGITVPEGYPRSVVDRDRRRFTGGGVSASIDLALRLLSELGTPAVANSSALITQYDPELPQGIKPGNPNDADPAIVKALDANPNIQKNFVDPIAAAVARQ